MNYYETLGIEATATKSEIKRAYLKLAGIHHPDKEGGDSETFKSIVEAYDVLYDDDKRAEYDATGAVKPQVDEREKINKQLSVLLLEIVDANPDCDYLDEMRLTIELKNGQVAKMILHGEQLIAKRKIALKRVVRTDGSDNLLASAIESDIKSILESIQTGLNNIAFNNKLIAELNNYMMASNELPFLSTVANVA